DDLDVVAAEHAELFEAIARRDQAQAGTLAASHLRTSQDQHEKHSRRLARLADDEAQGEVDCISALGFDVLGRRIPFHDAHCDGPGQRGAGHDPEHARAQGGREDREHDERDDREGPEHGLIEPDADSAQPRRIGQCRVVMRFAPGPPAWAKTKAESMATETRTRAPFGMPTIASSPSDSAWITKPYRVSRRVPKRLTMLIPSRPPMVPKPRLMISEDTIVISGVWWNRVVMISGVP